MKIGIITQPLNINYGGLLQNYALQQVLRSLGYDVYTINRNSFSIHQCSWNIILRWRIKRYIKKLIGREYPLTHKETRIVKQNCIGFIEENIRTIKISNDKEVNSNIKKDKFHAYIVGSDQVWRPCYSNNIYNDFLDFCQDETKVKRIAYAASFGVSEWEFNNEQTIECSRLAKLFDAISVREDSGIALCEEHLDVDAIHVLDPTLLLEKEDYIKLVEKAKEPISGGNLFCYILDNKDSIENGIKEIEQKLSLKSFQVKAKISKGTISKGEKLKDHVIPSPTKWLRAFMDAEMVFTDSFHGCVFSIIFNKPFWVIGNKERGNARFDSLLKQFNLESRRFDISEMNNIDLTQPIDWRQVNTIKKEWQEKSINFLKNNL